MTAIPPTAFSTTAIDRRPTREAPAVVTATVAAAGDISANLRRLTLHCPDFTALTLTGPDEFFGVLMPRPGDGYTPIPAYTGGNIRAHVGAIPERFRHLGSVEFSKLLLARAKVAVAPGLGFGEHGDGHVRIALVENNHRIRQALRGIRAFLQGDNLGPAESVKESVSA